MPPKDWSHATAAELAEALVSTRGLRDAIAYRGHLPHRPATYADPPAGPPGSPLDRRRTLAAAGIERLYSHQAEALAELDSGRNVLTVTPTASGKSLIYQMATLEELAGDPAARALYLFPYKALEQDQLASLRGLVRSAGLGDRITADIYDGDTPAADRRKIKADPPSVLITNPDMLHMGLLANHEGWRAVFSHLKLVVVDEMHVYRGIFGSHFHHVMRRLQRVCRRHGSSPRFIVSSATIGNPGEHASSLIGAPFSVVHKSGAPRSGQHFLFVNPPAGSPYTAATALIERSVREGFRTIAFTKARKITELIASWVASTAPDLMSRIAAYRAGYLPAERRDIEARLASGDLLGVVSTSALEHGIDIGGLEVCVLVGYPGSITSAWQRAGRVGRSDRESLVALVALPDALDQYFMAHPEDFFGRDFERACVDPANPVIASQHLVCAGAEAQLTEGDRSVYPEATWSLVEPLTRSGRLVADASGAAWYSLRRHPQRDVNLRAIGAGYRILEAGSGRAIGTVDGVRVFSECHPGALYLHRGQQFEILELDRDRRIVTARRSDWDEYTQALSEKETEILEVIDEREARACRVTLGRLRVTQEFKEYVRRRISDQQKVSSHPLDLPPLVYETIGLWWDVPDGLRDDAGREGHHFMGGLHASEHAAISLFPLLSLCDRSDIGGISYPAHPQTGGAAVFIYDGHPGGIGLAAKGFERIESLLDRTRALLAGCPCQEGCPSCVHSPKCGSGNHPLDKLGALFLLSGLMKPGPPPARAAPIALAPQPVQGRASLAGGPRAAPPARLEILARRDALPTGRVADGGRLLFFDLETRRSAEEVGGWDNIREMGLAVAVLYDEAAGDFRTFLEPDVDRLIVDLMSADRVVGFNLKRFDYTVLRGYRDAAYHRIPTCDMLEEIRDRVGFRLRLRDLAEATLGEGKSADGLQSLKWFKEGRLDLIESYCRRDVEVTRRLYHFGRTQGYLLCRDREQRAFRVPVDW